MADKNIKLKDANGNYLYPKVKLNNIEEFPTVVSNKYLHSNAQGALEWSDVGATGGVTSLGGATGAITVGNGLTMTSNSLAATLTDVQKNGTSIVNSGVANITYSNSLAADSNDAATITAIRAFVNSSITSLSAKYVTYNASGDSFPTLTSLTGASTYYYNGTTYTPGVNDYAIVDVDSSRENKTARYIYTGSQWNFQYVLNSTTFTQAQLDAINSTITSTLVGSYSTHIASTSNPHSVTKAQVGLGNVDNTSDLNKPISTATQTALDAKQATLVSGTNIKTINGTSILGTGDITIGGGGTVFYEEV